MMAEALFTGCIICCDEYSGKKKETFLSCRHSFCQICLKQQNSQGDRFCSLCKHPWSQDFLSSAQTSSKKMAKKVDESEKIKHKDVACSSHNLTVQLYCFQCTVLICIKCTTSNHRGHDFEVIIDCVPKMKRHIENIIASFTRQINTPMSEYKKNELSEVSSGTELLIENLQTLQTKLKPFINPKDEYEKLEFLSSLNQLGTTLNEMNRPGREASTYAYCLDRISILKETFPILDGSETSFIARIARVYKVIFKTYLLINIIF